MKNAALGVELLREGYGRGELLAVLESVVAAADPGKLVREALKVAGKSLIVGQRKLSVHRRRTYAIAVGKASQAMALAADHALGDRLTAGIAVVPSAQEVQLGKKWRVLPGGHPYPDERSRTAAEAVGEFSDDISDEDIVLCLLSGGGSALVAAPQPGLTVADLRIVTELLVGSGVPISEVNQVRSHLSTLGGGGLARRLGGAEVVTLALSDVVGSCPSTIASGPTSPDASTFSDARSVLVSHRLWERAPAAVRDRLEQGSRGQVEETAKPRDPVFSRMSFHLLADGASCLRSAARLAERHGWNVIVSPNPIVGDAREAGTRAGRMLCRRRREVRQPALWLGAGETTVVLRGHGRGGRNQEAAVATAVEIEGTNEVAAAWFGTDGIDGASDAAGAIVDGVTARLAHEAGHDERMTFEENDSYSFLAASGDLLITGPTGTNVADIFAGLTGKLSMGRARLDGMQGGGARRE
jgi:glycerate-2-kinase